MSSQLWTFIEFGSLSGFEIPTGDLADATKCVSIEVVDAEAEVVVLAGDLVPPGGLPLLKFISRKTGMGRQNDLVVGDCLAVVVDAVDRGVSIVRVEHCARWGRSLMNSSKVSYCGHLSAHGMRGLSHHIKS